MAVFAQRAFAAFRPGGMKIHAGAPVIEPGLEESDFAELAKAGVKLLGEVGLGGIKDGPSARKTQVSSLQRVSRRRCSVR